MASNHRVLEEADVALIEHVRLRPSLYDPQNPDFKMANRKEQDWNKVGEAVQLAAADARRRWTCLRDRYTRELKQMRLCPDKGDIGKNDFFRLMDFLRRFVRKRRERTQNKSIKGENSWDGSMDETTTMVVNHSNSEIDETDCKLEEANSNSHNFNNLELHDAIVQESVAHPQYVEVDCSSSFDDYTERKLQLPVSTTKAYRNSTVPVSLKHSNSVVSNKSGTFTISMPEMLQKQQPQQQHQKLLQQDHHPQSQQEQQKRLQLAMQDLTHLSPAIETEDDFFCKSIAAYLRQLSRRHKIKAKVEMFQILEKYIEIEENAAMCGIISNNNISQHIKPTRLA